MIPRLHLMQARIRATPNSQAVFPSKILVNLHGIGGWRLGANHQFSGLMHCDLDVKDHHASVEDMCAENIVIKGFFCDMCVRFFIAFPFRS